MPAEAAFESTTVVWKINGLDVHLRCNTYKPLAKAPVARSSSSRHVILSRHCSSDRKESSNFNNTCKGLTCSVK